VNDIWKRETNRPDENTSLFLLRCKPKIGLTVKEFREKMEVNMNHGKMKVNIFHDKMEVSVSNDKIEVNMYNEK
jgi:hypothetical protein